MRRRVLVVGGTGTFGRRLVRGLVATSDLGVVIGSRTPQTVSAFKAELSAAFPHADLTSVALDRDRIGADDLRALAIFAVVDAAEPFQGSDHRLARAAIAAGIHYVDLSDARDFAAGFAALDAETRAAGVVAVTSASSTPALSHAALDALTAGWRHVDTVEIGISPANRTPRGRSLVSAILSYAGRPVRLFLDGCWQTRPGWGLTLRQDFPGLGRRWLSLCETPDLDLVPARFGVRHAAIFRAGLELSVLHLGLAAAALPVRLGMLRSLAPFTASLQRTAGLFERLGGDDGGMIVEARGVGADGSPVAARWSLVAKAGDGPVVPTLPALAILRKIAAGELKPGAFVCVGLLTLDEIAAEFRPYRIETRIEIDEPRLYARALPGFAAMPAAVRDGHSVTGRKTLRGTASVEGAETAIGRALASVLRFPRASESVPVTVTMEARRGGEIWTRDFGGRRFRSVLRIAPSGRLSERFGFLTFDLDVPTSERGLTMAITGWRIGALRLPIALAPRTEAREDVDEEGRFRFDVTIALPGFGRLVRYRGWLVPTGR